LAEATRGYFATQFLGNNGRRGRADDDSPYG
jgi:hypothetical protein